METIGWYEMSATKYQSTLCNIPEEWISHLDYGGSLESRIVALLVRATGSSNQSQSSRSALAHHLQEEELNP